MKSPVLYQAAQGSRGIKVVLADPIVPPIAYRQCTLGHTLELDHDVHR